MKHLTIKRWGITLFLLTIFLLVVSLAGLRLGSETATWPIILYSRLPRIILGILTGIALGSTGTAFQALLNNPLADPYILGVSGGAALGCAIGVMLKLPFPVTALFAFACSFASTMFIYGASNCRGKLPPHTLLLTGVIYNAFAFAFIILVHSLVTMEQAHEILFTLIGNLEAQNTGTLIFVGGFVLCGFVTLSVLAPRLNIIAQGEDSAESIGVDTGKTRKAVFLISSIMVATVVSVCGLIGFIGLFIPHIARKLFGNDHRLIVPASGLLGGAFLVMADTVSRMSFLIKGIQTQLPVGAITALIGAPAFFWLMRKNVSS